MELIEHRTFDAERALYGSVKLTIYDCLFDGPADGESALKESREIRVEHCRFDLRYPFWHNHQLTIEDSVLSERCRAALWYSDHIHIQRTKMHGIKALRECKDVRLSECDIASPEFGWFTSSVHMTDCSVQSEYFMLRAGSLTFTDIRLSGKYSFQYIQNAVLNHCELNTKDALWHAKNVIVRSSVIKGEYLAWYSDGLTFEDCTIIGTQPLCYCKNLRLIRCHMIDTDLCFEKSQVDADLLSPVISIKNPYAGTIRVPAVSDIIMDDPSADGRIEIVSAHGV